MTSTQILSDFASALASGAIEVVDLTAPLGPETPLIKLPPEIGKNTPPIEIHAISHYDKDGPFWAWNWLKLGEHSGTHFDAPNHWISGKDYKDGSTDRIPVKNFVAPVCVIDCSAESAKNSDFLLTVDGVKAWEKTHGDIPAGSWVLMRTDWYKRNDSEAKFLNADEKGPHSPRSGRRNDPLSGLEGCDRLGFRGDRHGRGLRRRHGSAVSGSHVHAQGKPLRSGEPLSSRQAAAEGRDRDRGAVEDRQRHR
jgi:kynurenine formamidase